MINKMLKKTGILLLIITLLSSCEKEWYSNLNYYVENKTNHEYLIKLDYNGNDNGYGVEQDKICVVLPFAEKQVIDTYLLSETVQPYKIGHAYQVWVYNRVDSIYYLLSYDELTNGFFGRRVRKDTKQINSTLILDHYITVNDSLVSKMTKNTHITDSVFGLKK